MVGNGITDNMECWFTNEGCKGKTRDVMFWDF